MGCLGRRTAAASAARPAWRTRGVLEWGTSISSCISRTNPHEKLRAAFVPPEESPDGLSGLQVLRKQPAKTGCPPPPGWVLAQDLDEPCFSSPGVVLCGFYGVQTKFTGELGDFGPW